MGPENTLESFELAWSIGTIPEADIRISKDGIWFAFHDNNFERLVKDADDDLRPRYPDDLTWDELSVPDVGSWMGEQFAGQHIPKMSGVFDVMSNKPGTRIYVDTKEENPNPLIELARKYQVSDRLIFASTNYKQIRRWKEAAPESETLHWMGGTEERLRQRISELAKVSYEYITQLQIHVHVGDLAGENPFSPSPEFLQFVGGELKPRGILFQTLPMGNDVIDAYHRLMDLGVESFATDDPMTAIEAMKTYRPS